MKKKDLKKMALLGLAGGVMMTTQGTVQADESGAGPEELPGLMAAKSCGSGCGGHYHGCGQGQGSNGQQRMIADADEYTKDNSGQLMTEDQLMSQLNEQGKQLYKSLNPEGKALAIKLASRSCKGTNDCKGLGACAGNDHSCAGKNSCSGTSKCSFKDKNAAVKVAAQKQAEKRNGINRGSY